MPQRSSHHPRTARKALEKDDPRHPLIDGQDLALGSELFDGDWLHGEDIGGDVVVLVASEEVKGLAEIYQLSPRLISVRGRYGATRKGRRHTVVRLPGHAQSYRSL